MYNMIIDCNKRASLTYQTTMKRHGIFQTVIIDAMLERYVEKVIPKTMNKGK